MDLHYKLIFYTDWHCGSGLAAGADVDSLVVTDSRDLPYVPGKSIKGLVREAVFDYLAFTKKDNLTECYKKAFGLECSISKEQVKDKQKLDYRGEMHFSNAVLPETQAKAIIENDAVPFLFRKQSSTAIENNGIAKEKSLRRVQTVIPVTLTGSVHDVPSDLAEPICQAMKLIKRLGVGRNRGLGRCEFIIESNDKAAES